ncbi:hypothetical protein ACH4L5_01175 [Streptomyces sp. NPDC017405]|uniref:hypothetical protein n=1 Tax=unclassified Streptomyces TaxID=2593676 RepID=UPI0037B9416D
MRAGHVAAAVLAVVTAVTAAGCDTDPRPDLVVEGTAPARPYGGPLSVPTRELDESGPRALRLASGAAGRALECDGEIFEGSGPDGWSASEGGGTPEEGLALHFDMDQSDLPDHGYRVERRERDRVLYSYDVDGRTKAAVVVARDQKDRPGWGPETNASCDPAEFPESVAAAEGWEVWTDRAGRRVPVSRLHSSSGAEHCDWQSARFLTLAGRLYARDPEGVLAGLLQGPYHARVRMPAGARDTGYHRAGRRLWLTDGKTVLYVRTATGVEAWPRVKDGVGCA